MAENSIEPKKQKNVSVEISSLYSQSTKDMLRISLWNGKIGFSFSRLVESEVKSVFITLDYEKAIFLSMLINSIIRERVQSYKNNSPYQSINIPIEHTYIKDNQVHKVGTLTIKTVAVQSEITNTPVNRIAIAYEQAGETYEVALSSRIISKQILDKYATKEIDPDDARLFLFAKTLEGIINNLPVLSYITKLIEMNFKGNSYSSNSVENDTKYINAPRRNGPDVEDIPF